MSGKLQIAVALPALFLLGPVFLGGQVLVLWDSLPGWARLDPAIWGELWFTARIALLSAFGAVALGLGTAFLLANHAAKHREFWVAVLVCPVILPHMVAALLLMHLLAGSGMVARMLHACGILSGMDAFPTLLHDTFGVGIILTYFWKGLPFAALVLADSLRRIDPAVLEAARMLGASPWRTAWDVTLPLLRPAQWSCFLVLCTFALGAFEIPWLLGPNEPRALPVRVFELVSGAELHRRPEAMALSSLLALTCFGLCWLSLHLRKA